MAIEPVSSGSTYEPDQEPEMSPSDKALVVNSPEFNDLLLDFAFGAEASDILEDD